ncbi:response regulator [Aurantimonas sp. VKM B-3413]|uniref:response regulator n=1 Tax=Aurantimonas sp. VKM B-3413 TaxID=2779401 RepID=UPI001E5C7792|nr:response regulator [Aurantimonas sp. VKM B-3413]MCB8837056.1 response regulator [Aurantimonas sp. VKM B-3413]
MIDLHKRLEGRTVLVVEDEYYVADDLRGALERLGARVAGPVPSPAEAWEQLSRTPDINVAVLDVNLRGELVYDLADELVRREILCVFATGYDGALIPDRFRDCPRWQKPFDPNVFARSLPAGVDA